ncbi:MAG: hypothetical protein KKH52_01445 [Nanoarchaeota archaeon]|nr:hypothetical protein [Nanoarchaeota archaeon]MBU1622021.1 hypothetical protein [Nanoarchaeota archaeon]MBU1974041.1 hypothetical protein [Nanoarchaeota archaeon]
MDKHNLIIIILGIFLVGSLGFSFYVISGNNSSPQTEKSLAQELNTDTTALELEKTRLAQEKADLEAEKIELKKQLAAAEEKIPLLEVEKASPFDHVKESQVRVLKNKVEININNVEWWNIADTNSMDPLIDIGTTALSVKPTSEDKLQVGDVAFYHSLIAKRSIVHRIILIDNDEQGWYSTFKGDNLKKPDPEDVRFPEIEGVLIGIIY